MCDFNKIAGWLIAAQVLFLGMIVTMSIAVINSGSFWLAALNVPLMVGVCIACAAAAVLVSQARNEADNCKASICFAASESLRSWLVAFQVNLVILTGLLVAAAIVAPIPFAGAVAVGSVIIYVLPISLVISGFIENQVAQATSDFNACQEANSRSSNAAANTTIRIFAIITAVVILIAIVGGGMSGILDFPKTPPGATL
jgi:hypothetical protein